MLSNTAANLLSTSYTPIYVTQERFFTTLTIVYAFTLHASTLINSEYSLLSQKIMQEKCVKDILAKVNSEKLAKDQLKKDRTAELKKANRYKLGNRVVQKGGVITVKKTQEKIADTKVNKVTVA